MQNKDYSRRKFLNRFFGMGSVLFGSSLFLTGCTINESSSGDESGGKTKGTLDDPCDDLSGVSEKELYTRQSLGYVPKTPVPENFCGNCNLYIPPSSENECGGCLLFKGPVYPEGHCVQYIAKE
jgi:hypothetical protein